MIDREFKYWPKREPIPAGWQKTGQMEQSHHGRYSIIIERISEDGQH